MSSIEAAFTALRNGDPILVYDADDREGEVDLIYAAQHVTPKAVARLRNDAGGLICVAIPHDAAERLNIPFFTDIADHPAVEQGARAYGDRSSFALWVNHRDTYTGITDTDRATTITAIADHVADDSADAAAFTDAFTTPGHVAVLRAAEHLLEERRGHTEMSVYLLQAAGVTPAAVVCEMLDDDTGNALTRADAKQYAEKHGFVLLDGEDVLGEFSAFTSRQIRG